MGRNSKRSGKAKGSRSGESAEAIAFGKKLWDDLISPRKGTKTIAWGFYETFARNTLEGFYSLCNLVIKSAGYRKFITADMTNYDYPKLIEIFTREDYDEDLGIFPLVDKRSKVKMSTLTSFVSDLFELFSDKGVLSNIPLFSHFIEFLVCATRNGHRNVRHTAMFFVMKVLTGLFCCLTELQARLDSDEDPHNSRKTEELAVCFREIDSIADRLKTETYAAAFRDKCDKIQYLAVYEIKEWVTKAPQIVPQFEWFICQALVESSVPARQCGLEILEALLKYHCSDEGGDPAVEKLFKQTITSVRNATLDMNQEVAVTAITLFGNMYSSCPEVKMEVTSDDVRSVTNLVYSGRPHIAAAAGTFVYKLIIQNYKSFLLHLAEFHEINCIELSCLVNLETSHILVIPKDMTICLQYPELFIDGSEDLLLTALPVCAELFDWKKMITLAVTMDPEKDIRPVCIILAAAVRKSQSVVDREGQLTQAHQRALMTHMFLGPLTTLINRCQNYESYNALQKIVAAMDPSVLTMPKYDLESHLLFEALFKKMEHYQNRFPVVEGFASLLIRHGRQDVFAALVGLRVVYQKMATMVKKLDGTETPDEMERMLCLFSAFGKSWPLTGDLAIKLNNWLAQVAEDSVLQTSKWSEKAHVHALRCIHYYCGWARSYPQQFTYEPQQKLLMDTVMAFVQAPHSEEAIRIAISIGFDSMYVHNYREAQKNFHEFFVQVGKLFVRHAFGKECDEWGPIVYTYHRLILLQYINPELAAIFYQNYSKMSQDVQSNVIDGHKSFWSSRVFCNQFCATTMKGLKTAYIEICQAPNGRDPVKLGKKIAELAHTASEIAVSLKARGKIPYATCCAILGRHFLATLGDCASNPNMMAGFCYVLAPFAAYLLSPAKKTAIKLMMKIFAGKCLPAVKKIMAALKMKNVELPIETGPLLQETSTEERPISPIPFASSLDQNRAAGSRACRSPPSPSLAGSLDGQVGSICGSSLGEYEPGSPSIAGSFRGSSLAGTVPGSPSLAGSSRNKPAHSTAHRIHKGPTGHSTLVGRRLDTCSDNSASCERPGTRRGPSELDTILEGSSYESERDSPDDEPGSSLADLEDPESPKAGPSRHKCSGRRSLHEAIARYAGKASRLRFVREGSKYSVVESSSDEDSDSTPSQDEQEGSLDKSSSHSKHVTIISRHANGTPSVCIVGESWSNMDFESSSDEDSDFTPYQAEQEDSLDKSSGHGELVTIISRHVNIAPGICVVGESWINMAVESSSDMDQAEQEGSLDKSFCGRKLITIYSEHPISIPFLQIKLKEMSDKAVESSSDEARGSTRSHGQGKRGESQEVSLLAGQGQAKSSGDSMHLSATLNSNESAPRSPTVTECSSTMDVESSSAGARNSARSKWEDKRKSLATLVDEVLDDPLSSLCLESDSEEDL